MTTTSPPRTDRTPARPRSPTVRSRSPAPVNRPASSRASVKYLSTAASTARGGFRTGTPRRRDPMQGIHPEDDLFQAARRHHPHEYAVHGRQVESARLDRRALYGTLRGQRLPSPTDAETSGNGTACKTTSSRSAARLRSATCQPNAGTRATRASCERLHKLERLEALSAVERSAQDVGLTRPNAWTVPVSMFWNTTSAGLKRWGSTA